MLPLPVGREASSGVGAPLYVRHRPERSLLYRLDEEYYPAFKAHLLAQGAALPGYVEQEFEDYLECGRLEHGFLRMRCETCHAEHLVILSCKERGFCPSCGSCAYGRECSMLLLDGVYVECPDGSLRFGWVKAPIREELRQLTHTLAGRVGGFLERQGLLERDAENSSLASAAVDEDPMHQRLAHAITCRIAVGPQAGGATSLPCRRCRAAMSRSMAGWARWLASRCTPRWRPNPGRTPRIPDLDATPQARLQHRHRDLR